MKQEKRAALHSRALLFFVTLPNLYQLQQQQQSKNWGLFRCLLLWALVYTPAREILLEKAAWKNKIELCMKNPSLCQGCIF